MDAAVKHTLTGTWAVHSRAFLPTAGLVMLSTVSYDEQEFLILRKLSLSFFSFFCLLLSVSCPKTSAKPKVTDIFLKKF